MADMVARGMISNHQNQSGHRWAYNTDAGLRRWRAALAKLDAGWNGIVNVSVLGDSITEGLYSGGGANSGLTPSAWMTSSYVARIRNALKAKYGDTGQGFIPIYHPYSAPAWTFTGNWVTGINYGCTAMYKQSNSNGDTATLSFTGTGIGVMYTKGPVTGDFTIQIDAGTPITINSNSSSVTQAVIYEVTGLSNGSHTLTIKNTDAGGKSTYLHGAYPIGPSTSGVRVNMCGRYGTTTTDAVAHSALYSEIDVWNPALTIVALGANDYTQQLSLSTWKANLTQIVQRAQQYGDCLLVANGLHTNYTAGIQQPQYTQAMHDVAMQYNAAFIDVQSRWNNNGQYAMNTLGFFANGETVHPNDYGHQDMATAILSVILESGF